jgi:hypothetical protein
LAFEPRVLSLLINKTVWCAHHAEARDESITSYEQLDELSEPQRTTPHFRLGRSCSLPSRLLPLSLALRLWLFDSPGSIVNRVLVPFCVQTDASFGLSGSCSRPNARGSRLGSNTRAGSTRSSYLTISRRKRPRTIRNDCARSKLAGGCWSIAGYGHAVRSSADSSSSTY